VGNKTLGEKVVLVLCAILTVATVVYTAYAIGMMVVGRASGEMVLHVFSAIAIFGIAVSFYLVINIFPKWEAKWEARRQAKEEEARK